MKEGLKRGRTTWNEAVEDQSGGIRDRIWNIGADVDIRSWLRFLFARRIVREVGCFFSLIGRERSCVCQSDVLFRPVYVKRLLRTGEGRYSIPLTVV